MEVVKCFLQLVVRVQHEGTIVGDWLIQGLTGQKQHPRRLGDRLDDDFSRAVLVSSQLDGLNLFDRL